MFYNVSRHKLIDIIDNNFPEFTPITNLIYNEPGTVKYKWHTNNWNQIDMKEGVTQGCSLSTTFATLVLTQALIPLYDKLKKRAKHRLNNGDPCDDGFGGLAQIFAYMTTFLQWYTTKMSNPFLQNLTN